jgi:hypothetical protein
MSQAKRTSRNEVKVDKPGRERYETELAGLPGELVRLQEWVVRERARICLVLEGRDIAGKGGLSGASPSGSVLACSAWLRSRRRPSARGARLVTRDVPPRAAKTPEAR